MTQSLPENGSPDPLSTMSSSMPEAVRYHAWIMDLVRPHLGSRVLEIGFGYGQYTSALAGIAARVTAVDIEPDSLLWADRLPENARLLIADLAAPDFADNVGHESHSTVVCLNVLEHIEDERGALENVRRVLAPDGRFFVLVPAFMALYGPMDRMAGHIRRYTRARLGRALAEAGFDVLKTRYFNPIGGLGWWVNARFFKPASLSDPDVNRQIIWFDKYVQPISRKLDPLTRTFFGQSVWAVARPGQKDGA